MLIAFLGLKDLAPKERHGGSTRKTISDIAGLQTVLKIFNDDCGRFPTAAEGWKVLMSPPVDGSLTNWHGPYLDPVDGLLKDPWGHEYVYHYPAVHSTNGYDLYSLGPDGESKSGGSDPDDSNNRGKTSASTRMTLARLIDNNEDWLLLIPLFFVAGIIAQLTFPNVRQMAGENGWVDWLWFATALFAFYAVLLMPRISGY